MRITRTRLSVTCLLAVTALFTTAFLRASAASAALEHDVRVYSNPPLLKSIKKTMKGEKKDGTCVWHPPELTLQKGERAVAAHQVSADYTDCTTVVEIGTPMQVDSLSPDEVLGSEISSSRSMGTSGATRGPAATRRPNATSAYTNSQAYYRVTWYDAPGITLNYVRSILNWTWGNGDSCVLGSTQSWATFAQGGSGWGLDNVNPWKTTSCDSHYGHVSADFSNYIFCTPPTYTHYRDVRIRGGYLGGYGGYLGSTWADGACLPLHWGAQLVKEW